MKAMFQGYLIIAWFRMNFHTIKYKEYNKVMVKMYIMHYEKY